MEWNFSWGRWDMSKVIIMIDWNLTSREKWRKDILSKVDKHTKMEPSLAYFKTVRGETRLTRE